MAMTEKDREVLIDFFNGVEALCVKARMNLGDVVKPNPTQLNPAKPEIAINEVNFTQLKWEAMTGPKMGPFDIASKANNDALKFDQAYNVLKACSADIKNRYHGAAYTYAYWLYEENKIYRQQLKGKD